MPLDLGNHPARLAPAGRLVGEVRVVSADFVWGPSDRSFEQVADPVLQDLVGGQPDRVFDVLSLQVLVDTRHGEGGISPEIDAPDPAAIPQDHRLEHVLPAIGAVHIAGTQSAAFQIAELVEHEQRMTAGAMVMTVPDARSCSPWVGLTLESMSSTMPRGGLRLCTRSIQSPQRSVNRERFV